MEAGKHVVVDKPFTVTLSQARELDAQAKSAGRLLSVFHNRRWDSDF
jgi:predicted dehydrogenase